jgi:hypothetical protein
LPESPSRIRSQMSLRPRRAPGTWSDISIIGVRNGAGSLQRCLDSIAAQDATSRETVAPRTARASCRNRTRARERLRITCPSLTVDSTKLGARDRAAADLRGRLTGNSER